MPRQTRVFRLFVSSTFSDMRLERRLFRDEVFPRLDAFCRMRGARFRAVDLRWGVSEESQRNQDTMSICLKEIRRCQRLSPRPNFLILCGDRYGWQPLPSRISADEMAVLQDRCDAGDRKVIDAWYRLDTNVRAREHVLLPAGRRADEDWPAIETSLRGVLVSAARRAGLSERRLLDYTASATHREALLGALECAPESEPGHALAFTRTTKHLPDDARAGAYVDLLDGRRSEDARRRIDGLRRALETTLGEFHVGYQATWDGDLALDDADGLVERACERLGAVIEAELAARENADDAALERGYHRRFASTVAEQFGGRRAALARVHAYVTSDATTPLAVLGPSGSGKTCLLARAAEDVSATDAVVVCRFIGANAASSHLMSLLGPLCREIMDAYGLPLEHLVDDDERAKLHELDTLVELFKRCVSLSSPDKPLVLILDALDQLSEVDGAPDFHWLVTELPFTTRVIVSALPHLEDRLRDTDVYCLSPMSVEDAETVLDDWLARAGRSLTGPQRREVITAFDCTGLPLHLRLAFEEARHWRSYDPEPRLPASLDGMVNQLFDRLARHHSPELVSRAVAYLLCGRDAGLTEEEIQGVLAGDDEYWDRFIAMSHPAHREELEAQRTLPSVIWSRLHLDLEPYLTERDAYGETLAAFYHRRFDEILRDAYVQDATRVHSVLADYFARRAPWVDVERKHPDRRRAMELAWQLHEAGKLEALRELLTDYDAMRATLRAYDVDLLLRDYRLERHGRTEGLGLIRDALVLGSHVLRSDKEALGSQLQGRLLAFAGDGSVDRLLASWSPSGPCVRPLWASLDPPGGPLVLTISGRAQPVLAVAMGHDGRYAVVATEDDIVAVWSLETGREEKALVGHSGAVAAVAITPDGRYIVSGGRDNTVRVWSRATPREPRTMIGHTDEVTSVAVSRDGGRAISGSYDGTVRVWNLEAGSEEKTLAGDGGAVHDVALTPDGTKVVAGTADGTIGVWDVSSGVRETPLVGHVDAVEAVVVTDAGDHVVSGSMDGTVRVWDLSTRHEETELTGHEGGVTALCLHPDREGIVSGSLDRTIRVWHPRGESPPRRLEAHAGFVSSVSAVAGLPRLVSGSWDGSIKLWDLEPTGRDGSVECHRGSVDAVAITPRGTHVVSGAEDRALLVRDLATGKERRIASAHDATVEALAVGPDGRRVVSGSLDGRIKIWDLQRGVQTGTFDGHAATVYAIVVVSDGALAVSASRDHTVRMWSLEDGIEKRRPLVHASPVSAVSLTRDETSVVSGSSDGRIAVWDLATGQLVRMWVGHAKPVSSIAMTADGRRVVTCSWDGTIKVWDLASGAEEAPFAGHAAEVYALAAPAAGTWIASGSKDDTLKVWDPATSTCLVTYHADAPIMSCAASADGTTIAAGDGCGRVHALRWEAGTGGPSSPAAPPAPPVPRDTLR